jgi:hypothetical protein
MRRILHDVETYRNGLAGFDIAKLVIQLRAADNVSKQNCDFQILCHPAATLSQLMPNAKPGL